MIDLLNTIMNEVVEEFLALLPTRVEALWNHQQAYLLSETALESNSVKWHLGTFGWLPL